MPEIIIKNATKRFGSFLAVDKLDITIQDKGFVTLLGPSGCGKTTTLRMISGLENPTEGEIYIDDVLVFSSEKGIALSPAKRDVGFLFQNYALWPHMTVSQNIAFGLENLKWNKADINHRVHELTELLKIDEFLIRYPAEFV
jgi:multiple sugar transport system ATP-binding protein